MLVSGSDTELTFGDDPTTCQNSTQPSNSYCAEFRDNSATTNGGAVLVENGATLTVSNTAFIDNVVGSMGIGPVGLGSAILSTSDDDTLYIENSLFGGNGGTAIYITGAAQIILQNNTITGSENKALVLEDGAVKAFLRRNIIWGNSAGVTSAAVLAANSCNISQNGLGGVSIDPLFETTARGDYRLSENSPAVDACTDGPARDLDGRLRPQQSHYDVGAFEYEDDEPEVDEELMIYLPLVQR